VSVTFPTAFQRARSDQHKQQRAEDLLAAARELSTGRGSRTVSLTAIAQRAGVHASGVRRYFDSREDILLALAAEQYQEWADAVAQLLGEQELSGPDALAAALAESLVVRPLLCDLQAHIPLSLERESSMETVRTFKLTALAATRRLATSVSRALPALPPDAAFALVAGTLMLAGQLWQMAHPSAEAQQLYAEDPRLDGAVLDFVPWLTRLVAAMAVGLAATPVSPDSAPAAGVAAPAPG
jgi:AcrR family transcriptional regulator